MSSGIKVAAIADTPKVITDRRLAPGHVHRRAGDRREGREAQGGLRRTDGRTDGGTRAELGEVLGVERAPIEVVDDGLRHSVRIGDGVDFEIEDIVPFGIETGQPVRFVGMFHPAGSELTARGGEAVEHQRLRHRYEGKTGLSTSESPGPPDRLTASAHDALPAAAGSRRRSRPPARGWGSSPSFSRWPRSAGGGRSTRCRGWTAARGRLSERAPGSSAS